MAGGAMMAVKFKVGFTMSAETLFGIIAKFLPVEDLHVEEIAPKVEKIARLEGPKNRHLRAKRPTGYPVNLEAGVNGVILRFLADGQAHRFADLRAATAKAGYSPSGIGSKLDRLRELGHVERVAPGMWRRMEAKKTA
jgi:hypothetical protein